VAGFPQTLIHNSIAKNQHHDNKRRSYGAMKHSVCSNWINWILPQGVGVKVNKVEYMRFITKTA